MSVINETASPDLDICGAMDANTSALRDRVMAMWEELCIDTDFYDKYIELLKLTYMYVRHSVELMEKAARALTDTDDENYAEFRAYFSKHVPEEVGHDKWVLEDLAYLGVELDSRETHPIINRMIGGQYYLIENVHPLSLLGYMYVLEAKGLNLSQVLELSMAHAIPPNAMRALLRHAELDIEHASDLVDVLGKVTDRIIARQIVCSAAMALESICEIYEEVRRS